MNILQQFGSFFGNFAAIFVNPVNLLVLFGSVILGIVFGALPGLTATLGVALLTTVTYGLDMYTALIALLGIYVGAVYGGSYGSVMINIPGTAAAAATALDGYPLAKKGEAGIALGLTTTVSAIGTAVGMVFALPLPLPGMLSPEPPTAGWAADTPIKKDKGGSVCPHCLSTACERASHRRQHIPLANQVRAWRALVTAS